MSETPDEITLSADGFAVPTVEVLTGRGFITGKSGSGKSNTASVVAEELLDASVPLMLVDTDGEYYGLKEQYELLHVGGDNRCDLQVDASHADRLAKVALDRGVPIILDTSGFDDPDEGRELVGAVVERLFAREKEARTPFLLVVEEAHEFVPQQGGLDDVGETLVRVAKRGRKRGLGMCALSQRPASVSKDYITQCDWLVWHRLTWENDTAVVSRILGDEAAADVHELADGEAIVRTDWDGDVRRVRFRRKRTFDAGATPDLDDIERPDLRSVDDDLIAALRGGDDDAGPGDDDSAAGRGGDTAEAGESAETTTETTDAAADGGDSRGSRGGTAGGGAGTSGTATGHASADPAADTAWEVAQFLTYLSGRLVAAVVRLFTTVAGALATAAALAERALSGVVQRAVQPSDGRPGEEPSLDVVETAVGVLLALVVVALVVAFGLVLGVV
jgi:hypothetical protein